VVPEPGAASSLNYGSGHGGNARYMAEGDHTTGCRWPAPVEPVGAIHELGEVSTVESAALTIPVPCPTTTFTYSATFVPLPGGITTRARSRPWSGLDFVPR